MNALDGIRPEQASILPLRLRDVCFEIRGRRLLDRINLEIAAATDGRGQVTVILGPNGAGKSLLLRICHGLLRPSLGSVDWAVGGAQARLRQAMVFQRPVLLRRSVRANIDYALRRQGLSADVRQARLQQSLEAAGLARQAEQAARSLSGGEQQKLALARAWALQPQILFLDEPCANLDPAATRAVEQFVQQIAALGIQVVMTTHDLGQAKRIADEVVFIQSGQLVERSPAPTFFRQPASAQAIAFVAGHLYV